MVSARITYKFSCDFAEIIVRGKRLTSHEPDISAFNIADGTAAPIAPDLILMRIQYISMFVVAIQRLQLG